MNTLDKIKSLQAQLNELEQECAKDWPQNGYVYYYVGNDGKVYNALFSEDDWHTSRLKTGNVYRTLEEAQLAAMQAEALRKLMKMDGVCIDIEYLTPEHSEEAFVAVGATGIESLMHPRIALQRIKDGE